MLTRKRWRPPAIAKDWQTDRRNLVQSISDYLLTLEAKQSLTLDSASGLDNTPVGANTASTGAFTTLAASGLISANGGQVKFPATQNASSDANTLDDYEEGSGTLSVTFATPGTSSFSSTENNYTYTKIGQEVIFRFNVVGTITIGAASGALKLTGVPFTNANVGSNFPIGSVLWGDNMSKTGYTQMVPVMPPGASYIQFGWSGAGVAGTDVNAADITTSSTLRLRGMLIFHV